MNGTPIHSEGIHSGNVPDKKDPLSNFSRRDIEDDDIGKVIDHASTSGTGGEFHDLLFSPSGAGESLVDRVRNLTSMRPRDALYERPPEILKVKQEATGSRSGWISSVKNIARNFFTLSKLFPEPVKALEKIVNEVESIQDQKQVSSLVDVDRMTPPKRAIKVLKEHLSAFENVLPSLSFQNPKGNEIVQALIDKIELVCTEIAIGTPAPSDNNYSSQIQESFQNFLYPFQFFEFLFLFYLFRALQL